MRSAEALGRSGPHLDQIDAVMAFHHLPKRLGCDYTYAGPGGCTSDCGNVFQMPAHQEGREPSPGENPETDDPAFAAKAADIVGLYTGGPALHKKPTIVLMGVIDPPPPASLSGSTARVEVVGQTKRIRPVGKDPSAKFWSGKVDGLRGPAFDRPIGLLIMAACTSNNSICFPVSASKWIILCR
jgi:hypothetical protein